MPIARYSLAAAQQNLSRQPNALWPDGRKGRGARLEGIVTVEAKASFALEPGEPIFTVGSCFARSIERRLAQLGFDVVTQGLVLEETGAKDIDTLNKYNPPSMLNEFRWALEPGAAFPDDGFAEGDDGLWCDLQLLGRIPPTSRARVAEWRAAITALYVRLKECRVVVITLGLVEAWFDTTSGLYINGAPPAPVARRYPDRFELHVLTATEAIESLEAIHDLLRRHGHPDFRMLLTVSPVPFKATFTGQDAIAANTYSKSALRAAAEEFVARHDDVDYFPSYEIVTLTNRASAFIEDNIHVAPEVVDMIMDGVVRRYAPSLFEQSAKLDEGAARGLAALAREWVEAGDFDKAAKCLHALAREDAWRLSGLEEFEFRFLYGRAMSRTGKLIVGEIQLRKALEVDPRSAPASHHLALVRSRLGHHAEAEEFARLALKLDPGRRAYRMVLIELLIQLGRHAEADRQLTGLLADEPDDAEAAALQADCRDAIDRQDRQGGPAA